MENNCKWLTIAKENSICYFHWNVSILTKIVAIATKYKEANNNHYYNAYYILNKH